MSAPDLEKTLLGLRQEFLNGCEDRFKKMDEATSKIMHTKGVDGEHLITLKRQLHTLKGTAGSYDFKALSIVAHAAERYLATTPNLASSNTMKDIKTHISKLRVIAQKRLSPEDEETAVIIKDLPQPPKHNTEPE